MSDQSSHRMPASSEAGAAPAQARACGVGRAEACANIALAKYWGKSPRGDNLTAVPSLSMTLDKLSTRTEVRLDENLETDVIYLNGEEATAKRAERITALLERMRQRAGSSALARVDTKNNFPTAAGLASSASGFAALAVAASRAYGLDLDLGVLSSEARRSSASAGRSLFAGFAELRANADQAEAVASTAHWALRMVVLVVRSGQKPISSTGGMNHTAQTCPYYPRWLEAAPAVFAGVRAALLAKDFSRLAEGMEHSTRLMHATMFTSLPPILYLRGTSVELMHEVSLRRSQGHEEAYTMDAGPNVKILTTADHLESTLQHYRSLPGIESVIACAPGPGAAELELGGALDTARRTKELS